MKTRSGRSVLTTALKNVANIAKKEAESDKKNLKKNVTISKEKPDVATGEKIKPFRSSRGIVYVGHIPHGFYEEEMREFFKQFGRVNKVRVARSRKTGKSKGFAYVEFTYPEVAKIAADTMNNYLMCGRLLKTTYIPPEKQHVGFFAGRPWSAKKYPKAINRKKSLEQQRGQRSDEANKRNARKTISKIKKLEEKLKGAGINLKIKPFDIPK